MKQINYYVSGHTSQGKVNLLQSNLIGIERIIALEHPSLYVKTVILERLMKEKNERVELLRSPEGKQYIEGVIFRSSSVAVIDAELITESITERVTKVDVTKHIPIKQVEKTKRIDEEIESLQRKAYDQFKEGLDIHHDIEQLYVKEMDFACANEIANNWKETLIPHNKHQTSHNETDRTNERPHVYERFFGTNTPDGIVNEIERLIAPLKRRLFIKGRAGTGKSFFMTELLNTALERGYTVEKYRCSLDPLSIDMGIIPELNCCFFDSTAPHELDPLRKEDTIVDLYELTVTPGTDEKYANEITPLQTAYKKKVRAGLSNLQATKRLTDEKEALYKQITDDHISFVLNEIVNSKF